jgi:hypothetical protein
LGFPLPEATARKNKGEATVTRDEARQLLSGYATGSLTEQERQLLFDAALEDQELFEELADEHALKELIELPSAKQRLLAALGPEKKTLVWWPWAAVAALATASVSVWFLLPRTVEAPVQIAQNAEPAAAIETLGLETASQPAPAQPASPSAPQARTSPAPAATLENKVTENDTAVAAAQDAIRERQTATTPTETRALPATLPAEKSLPIRSIGAASAPPAAQTAKSFLAAPSAAVVAFGDALTYDVTAQGILRVVPSRTGVLEVIAGTQTLFGSNPVVAGTPIELLIPPGAQQLRIDFAVAANAPAVAAVPSTEPSGTLRLPGGTNPRIAITIPARR